MLSTPAPFQSWVVWPWGFHFYSTSHESDCPCPSKSREGAGLLHLRLWILCVIGQWTSAETEGHGPLCKLCCGDDIWGQPQFKPSGKILQSPYLCWSPCNSFGRLQVIHMMYLAEDITNALSSHGLWGKIFFIVQQVLDSYLETLEPFHCWVF